MSNETGQITRIIACAVFKPALRRLLLRKRYPGLRVTCLPAVLHLRPKYLEKRLRREFAAAKRRGERVICLYGECFPGISAFCREQGVAKLPGDYCYEMLLGSERFGKLVDEITGTYFAEKDLILDFEEMCMRPLELDDEDLRESCFAHYRRLLYVRQPDDREVMTRASDVASFLGLSLEIEDADYSHLERELVKLI
jgi:hypothetical protein